MILGSQPPKCWDYKRVPPRLTHLKSYTKKNSSKTEVDTQIFSSFFLANFTVCYLPFHGMATLPLSNTTVLVLESGSKPGVVAHACNPSIWEAETRGSRFEDSLSYLVRLSTT